MNARKETSQMAEALDTSAWPSNSFHATVMRDGNTWRVSSCGLSQSNEDLFLAMRLLEDELRIAGRW